MYAFSVDHVIFDRHRDGRPVTLTAAIDAVRGVSNARIWRIAPDGTLRLIVRHAGSTSAPWEYVRADDTTQLLHHHSARTLQRRCWHPRRRHLATVA